MQPPRGAHLGEAGVGALVVLVVVLVAVVVALVVALVAAHGLRLRAARQREEPDGRDLEERHPAAGCRFLDLSRRPAAPTEPGAGGRGRGAERRGGGGRRARSGPEGPGRPHPARIGPAEGAPRGAEEKGG